MRLTLIPTGFFLTASLVACAPEPQAEPEPVVNEMDPYLARALNDPLMVDPDLAYRSEANAAITLGLDHALPSFKGSEEAASLARETARLALQEEGAIPELPVAQSEPGPATLDNQFGVGAVLDTVNAPPECRKSVTGSFAFAATMPDLAAIMPHGMVRVAAAVEQPGCTLRLVRYVTPAAIEDVLLHHHTLATRAGLEPLYFTAPEHALIANRRGTSLHVYARATSGDLNAVDVITWTR